MHGTGVRRVPHVRTASWSHDAPGREAWYPGVAPLPGTALPDALNPEEASAAAALLAGRPLRIEVYGTGGGDREEIPYLVTEHRYAVSRRAAGGLAVRPLETVTTYVERCPGSPDPRVEHEIVLAADEHGYVTESVHIGYPRVIPRQPGQEVMHVTLTRHEPAAADGGAPRVPARTRAFALTGVTPPRPGGRLTPEDVRSALATARARLVADTGLYYWDDRLTGPLPFGRSGSVAQVHHTRRLAFTRELLDEAYGGRVDDGLLRAAGYLRDEDGHWITVDACDAVPDRPEADAAPGAVVRRDPLGRVTRVEHADGTVAEVEHHAWRRETWDACDTVRDSRWYGERGAPDPFDAEPAAPEARAAWLAAHHADTPANTHLDPLGRAVIEVVDADGLDQFATHRRLDALGRVRTVTDPRGLLAETRVTDLLGRELRLATADGGTRLVLPDAVGRPVRRWYEDGATVSYAYPGDGLEVLVRERSGPERLAELTVVAPGSEPVPVRFDGAGATRTETYGDRAVSVVRRLARSPERDPDWSALRGLDAYAAERAAAHRLEPYPYVLSTVFDGSVVRERFPDGTELALHRRRGVLTAVSAALPDGRRVPVIEAVERDPVGRPVRIAYGDGTSVRRAYDPTGALVADGPRWYAYDALGRLVRAESPEAVLLRAYDPVGNALSIVHTPTGGAPRIVRCHHEEDPETGDPVSNRLVAHSTERDPEGVFSALVEYDGRGRMTRLPHLPGAVLGWDHADRLRRIDFGDGRTAVYTYGADGIRVRATVTTGGVPVDERVHIGAWTRHATPAGVTTRVDVYDGDRHLASLDPATGRIGHGPPPPDPESGLLHREGRVLAPWLGRWLAPPYAYTGPVDPGHTPWGLTD